MPENSGEGKFWRWLFSRPKKQEVLPLYKDIFTNEPLTPEQERLAETIPEEINQVWEHLHPLSGEPTPPLPQSTIEHIRENLDKLGPALTHKKHFCDLMHQGSVMTVLLSPVRQVFSDFFENNLEFLERVSRSGEHRFLYYGPPEMLAVKAISGLLEKGVSPRRQEKAVTAIENNRELMETLDNLKNPDNLEEPSHTRRILELMTPYLLFKCRWSQLDPMPINTSPRELLSSVIFSRQLPVFDKNSVLEKFFADPQGKTLITEIAKDFLSSATVLTEKERDDIICSWPHSGFPPALTTIQRLEGEMTGTTAFLYRQYGITHFERYPLLNLMSQIKQHNDQGQPYGVVLSAYQDHEGALYFNKAEQELVNDLKRLGYLVRFVEARDKTSAVRRIVELNKRYGDSHKISFLIIRAHGNRRNIQLGRNYFDDAIRITDVRDSTANQRLNPMYEPGAPFIFESCSTGLPGGIVEAFSETLNRETVGPDKDTSVKKITVSKKNGALKFELEYDSGSPMKYGSS